MRSAVLTGVLLLSSLGVVAQQGPSSTTIIQPCRLFDSRELPGGDPLDTGITYQIQARGACGVPGDANAILFNATALGAEAAGHLTVWASDLLQPAAATMTYRGNGADTSGSASRLCAPPILECSEVDLSFRLSTSPSHVILDIVGYTVLIE